jgi:hypothetical protein
MPIQNTDLMVIQQAGTPYKVSTQTLKTYFQTGVTLNAATAATLGGIKVGTNLTVTSDGTLSANITGALTYKGVKDLTAAPTGLTPAVGDLYVNSKAGNADAGFTGIGGTAVTVGEMVIYDGAKWDIVGVGAATGTLTAVTADAPITVTNTNPAQPHLAIAAATPATGGAGGTSGLLTASDKEKLDGIASGAKAGTVTTVTATAPLHVASPTTTPALTIDNASTTAAGVVQLADAAAVTAGTAGRVVDAAQLKVVADAVTTAAAGGVTSVTGTAPISVTGTTTRAVAIADASTGAKGAVQLATNAEVLAGTDATKAVTPVAAKATYLPKDISTLTLLP